jgi:ferredoxin/flavodoxin---NADP+ reductase
MTTFEVAIVGSGPSGFFATESLLKARADARVHMFDRLPTPYGLVRSGVAPDHQQIKQVIAVFEKIARDPRFSFSGNVEIGKDVALEALRLHYDAVILATGASEGVRLDVPNADLEQNFTATQFVGWYNGHPDYSDLPVKIKQDTAVIIGHGNVAVDVARILLSEEGELAKTDIADHALDVLRSNPVRKADEVPFSRLSRRRNSAGCSAFRA